MKKILLAMMATCLMTICVQAQTKKNVKPASKDAEYQKEKITECCIMKNGKMYHYNNGKETAITKEMDMNGMKIYPDGTCKMKDGKSMKLKDGECCDTKGMVHKDCHKMIQKS